MSAYSDSVSEPVFSEPDPVSAKKNIETEVEIGFFRSFPFVFIAKHRRGKATEEQRAGWQWGTMAHGDRAHRSSGWCARNLKRTPKLTQSKLIPTTDTILYVMHQATDESQNTTLFLSSNLQEKFANFVLSYCFLLEILLKSWLILFASSIFKLLETPAKNNTLLRRTLHYDLQSSHVKLYLRVTYAFYSIFAQ
jgi:hypothetical protein